MSNLPKGWEKQKLSDIINLIHGYQFRTNDFTENGIAIIKIGNVNGTTLDLSGLSYISKDRFEEFKQYELNEGDILMSLTGNIGRVVEVSNLPFKVLQNYRVGKFEAVDSNIIFKKYIKFLLSSNIVLDRLEKLSNQSAQANFGKQDMDKIFVSLPPLEEQKKIADILSTVDKKIAFVEENINATEELKKSLMQKLLTEGIGHTEFKDSELGRIPKSWEVVQFDKVCDIRDGTHDSPKYIESGIPFITSKHLTDNGIDFTETNYISKENHIEFSKRSKVDNGDILFGMIGTIGKPNIVNTDFEFSIKNIALLKLSCNELLSNIYVLNLLKSNIITKQFSKLSNGGVQSFIALGMIRKLKIPLPPLEEQKQIAEILSTVDKKLENLKEKKLSFEELKKGLMQKLLTGEVRV